MKKFFSVLMWLLVAPASAVWAQCLEFRTNAFNDNYTNWYSTKQEACTASAEAYQNKVNESYPGVVDYVGTLSADSAICQRRGTVTYSNGQVGPIAAQDVGWFQERGCQYKPEEASCSVGNPTLPGLGTKTHSESIYAGSFVASLSFDLSYRSTFSGRSAVPDGTWLHSYSGRLHIDALVSDVHALSADGRMVRFSKDSAADTWTSSESADTLVRVPAADPVNVVWELQRHRDNTREIYDHTGRLQRTVARNGWVTSLTYSTSGQLQSVANAFGRQLGFAWDSNGFLSAFTDPGGGVTRFSHDVQGNLLAIIWPDGNIKRYHYEDSRFPRALTGITDEIGQRIGSYSYDTQGRVSETQRASGVDRLQFSYSSDAAGVPQTQVIDFSTGTPTARTHRFTLQGRVLRPAGASAPCPLCGSTGQAVAYDASGKKVREISHDGSVTFYAYDTRGRETERATFPTAYNTATTRPALANATQVISTRWHASCNLPTQIAEPNKTTANTYNSKGMLTGQSWTATTDNTGAAKFTAVKTGSTYATGWGYNANSLATTIVQRVDAVEVRRWNFAFNALGDATKVTATEGGISSVAILANSTAHGLLTQLSADNGAVARFTYNSRNQLATAQLPDYGATLTYDPRSLVTEIRLGPTRWLRIVYDPSGNPLRLEDSVGQSQLIVGLAEPSGMGPRGEAAVAAAAARVRALISSLRDPATTARWLPLTAAQAQPLPPPVVPARILQGLSLAPTQQAVMALDLPIATSERSCCSVGTPGSSQAVRDQLNRAMIPIRLMSYGATMVSGAIADEILIQKSAYKLRKNLCAVGVTKPEVGCHHAHHIVAVADRRAAKAREVLARVGLAPDHAANGMFVPCNQHGSLHTNSYYIKVDNIVIGPTQADVVLQLGAIRLAIANGTF